MHMQVYRYINKFIQLYKDLFENRGYYRAMIYSTHN